jgi:predicted transglutaminase-like cysteine proteinase
MRFSVLLCSLSLIVAASAATADERRLPQMASAAAVTKDALPPIGWVQFCSDHNDQCDVAALPAKPASLSKRAWNTLVRINNDVNREIEPVSDQEQWGVLEKWSMPTTGKGDCEDYVLEKRKRLIEAGFPRQSLLITVVRDQKGDGHAVLTVKTDRGDFVLDNQERAVRAWEDTGYRFVKRQSEQDPNRWVSLGGPEKTVFTASR